MELLVYITCLDLEGVLVPEIWIAFAEYTKIEALKATTRDIPDYNQLMRQRLRLLDEHNLRLSDIQDVISKMKPLPGALDFLNWLNQKSQVIILSDTFYEFAEPLMKQLDSPTLFCNNLIIGGDGSVDDYVLRQQDGKRRAVKALHELNFKVIAAGDSYNDTTMLKEADSGIFFRPPQSIVDEFPQFPIVQNYVEFKSAIEHAEKNLNF
jgi:phosphoserine / homoserine phosphotransferase